MFKDRGCASNGSNRGYLLDLLPNTLSQAASFSALLQPRFRLSHCLRRAEVNNTDSCQFHSGGHGTVRVSIASDNVRSLIFDDDPGWSGEAEFLSQACPGRLCGSLGCLCLGSTRFETGMLNRSLESSDRHGQQAPPPPLALVKGTGASELRGSGCA